MRQCKTEIQEKTANQKVRLANYPITNENTELVVS